LTLSIKDQKNKRIPKKIFAKNKLYYIW